MEITLTQKAEKFAADKHKGLYGTKPYIHHLKMVIDELLEVIDLIPKQHQDAVIAAAWLHDIMEDEKINNAVLEDEFGKEVAELVWLLTNHTGKRASPEYYEKLKSNPFATIIKLCDRIANVKYSLAGKEKLHPNESDVTKQNEQMRCEHKFAMYKSENDVFVSSLKNTPLAFCVCPPFSKETSHILYEAVVKLSLKLVHLFNQPQIRAEKEAEMNKNVRKLNIFVLLDNQNIETRFERERDAFTSIEIMGMLELVTANYREKHFGINKANIDNLTLDSNQQRLSFILSKISEIEGKISNQAAINHQDEFMDIKSAAKFLHLSNSRLYTICQKERISHIKRGKKLLFTREGLLAYLNEGKRRSRTERISDTNNNGL